MVEKISSNEITEKTKALDGWRKVEGRDAIQKSFKFKDFVTAFAFMQKIAIYAEQINHHPEWSNTYNIVDVTLSTHDVNGLSSLDFLMAAEMDRIV